LHGCTSICKASYSRNGDAHELEKGRRQKESFAEPPAPK
jgi:hypothetical protein